MLATLIGVYFGWIFLATGDLYVVSFAHGVYDLIALVYLLRVYRREANVDRICSWWCRRPRLRCGAGVPPARPARNAYLARQAFVPLLPR